MSPLYTKTILVGASLVLSACASVPEVESRLQALQLDPYRYTVQSGDTLEAIAARYRLDEAQLHNMNPGLGAGLLAGSTVVVRAGAPDAAQAERSVPATHSESAEAVVTEVAAAPTVLPQATADEAIGVVREIPALAIGAAVAPNAPLPREEIIDEAELDAAYQNAPLETVRLEALPAEAVSSATAASAAGWVWPTQGKLARGYTPGQGIDIAGAPGEAIHAAHSGTVLYSGRDLSGNGNLVIIEHADGMMSTYAHAAQLYVAENDTVQAGDPIATLGANGEHESVLRFEVRRDGQAIDPAQFLSLR